MAMLLKHYKNLSYCLLCIFCVELLRTAWISDDAAITLRTVLNFIHGFGPTFNVDERVQAYTHPLWFLLISALALIIKNVFAATFIISISLSLLALWLVLAKLATNTTAALIAVVGFLLSKSCLDFSTSGLENPLSHVLLAFVVLLACHTRRSSGVILGLYFLTCSFVYLSRPDLLLMIVPLTLLVISQHRTSYLTLGKVIVVGALPALLWTLFSLYYYGFPFPNTAYAKLGAGIAPAERAVQGMRYLLDSLDRDPITLTFIIGALAFTALRSYQDEIVPQGWRQWLRGVFARHDAGTDLQKQAGTQPPHLNLCLALGVVLYLLYVVCIGGDFMAGRFLTPPFFVACILYCRHDWQPGQQWVLAMGVIVLGAIGIQSTLLSNSAYINDKIRPVSGIADERGFYFQSSGLLNANKTVFKAPPWKVAGRNVEVICGGLGFTSISRGPGTHFVDECALSDPLLARLPARFDPNWRIGHFVRQLPTDYMQSVREPLNNALC